MTKEQIEDILSDSEHGGVGFARMRRLVDEREALLAALREIESDDHAEDGGPTCDHARIADVAIKKAES